MIGHLGLSSASEARVKEEAHAGQLAGESPWTLLERCNPFATRIIRLLIGEGHGNSTSCPA
jgi:hypothetical protein